MKRKSFWFNFFMVILGVILGTFAVDMTKNISYLNWLGYSLDFSTISPLSLNLQVINFSFSCNISISISVVICTLLTIIIGNLCRSK